MRAVTKLKHRAGFVAVLLETIGWPLVWGTAASVAFYYLIHAKLLTHPLCVRYAASHPVEYVEVWLFFVGLAAILMKLLDVVNQFSFADGLRLPPRPDGGQRVTQAAVMLQGLRELPRDVQRSYLGRRAADALEFVSRRSSASGLEQELKHLADGDLNRQTDSYAFCRIIVWAIPMLGFLGTVIGITMALADLSPQNLVSSPETAMEGMLAGLSVAFDTTALALSLAVILMFAQFATTRIESQLLEHVTSHLAGELVGRFEDYAVDNDPAVAKMAHLTELIIRSTEQMFGQVATRIEQTSEGLVSRQAELWAETVSAAQSAWRKSMESATDRGEAQMAGVLEQQIQGHQRLLLERESQASERLHHHWSRFEQALNENAHVMQSQQTELVRQGDHLLALIQRIGELGDVQRSLTDNLAALRSAGKLEESLNGLAAVSHLLNARLGLATERPAAPASPPPYTGTSRIVAGAGTAPHAGSAEPQPLRLFPRDGRRNAA